MIIKRQKDFSLFDRLFKKFDRTKSVNKESMDEDLPETRQTSNKIKLGTVNIEDVPDVWPGLVVMGIAADDTKEDGGWGGMFDWMKSVKFFDNPSPELLSVDALENNVNGEDGMHCYLMTFSPKTEINTGMRLAYGKNFKWPDDFYYNYRDWYKK